MSGSSNTASRWTTLAPRWTWWRRRPATRKRWNGWPGYQGVIYSHGHYRLHTFDELPDLVGVIAPTVGVDHVDIEAATAAGVVVGNIPTFATEQTADTALYLMLGAVRRIPRILTEWQAGHRGIHGVGTPDRPHRRHAGQHAGADWAGSDRAGGGGARAGRSARVASRTRLPSRPGKRRGWAWNWWGCTRPSTQARHCLGAPALTRRGRITSWTPTCWRG